MWECFRFIVLNHNRLTRALPLLFIDGTCPVPLFEHLPVRPLVRLAVNLDWLVPAPLVTHKLLVGSFGWVEFGELVAVDVGRDVERGRGILPSHKEGALDDGVLAGLVHRCAAEDVFA